MPKNPAFLPTLYADVFRQWKAQELLDLAFAPPLICDPGTCFHYAHTNFVILNRAIHKITGQPVARLMRTRVLRPLGLRHTDISALPGIPAPVLHATSPTAVHTRTRPSGARRGRQATARS